MTDHKVKAREVLIVYPDDPQCGNVSVALHKGRIVENDYTEMLRSRDDPEDAIVPRPHLNLNRIGGDVLVLGNYQVGQEYDLVLKKYAIYCENGEKVDVAERTLSSTTISFWLRRNSIRGEKAIPGVFVLFANAMAQVLYFARTQIPRNPRNPEMATTPEIIKIDAGKVLQGVPLDRESRPECPDHLNAISQGNKLNAPKIGNPRNFAVYYETLPCILQDGDLLYDINPACSVTVTVDGRPGFTVDSRLFTKDTPLYCKQRGTGLKIEFSEQDVEYTTVFIPRADSFRLKTCKNFMIGPVEYHMSETRFKRGAHLARPNPSAPKIIV